MKRSRDKPQTEDDKLFALLADSIREVDGENTDVQNVLKREREKEKLDRETQGGYFSDDYTYSDEEEDEGTFNIEDNDVYEGGDRKGGKSEVKKQRGSKPDALKIEVPPHIDPNHLVCKDAVQYVHLLIGSRSIPSSGDLGGLGYSSDKSSAPSWKQKLSKANLNELLYVVKEITCDLDMDDLKFGLRGSKRKNDHGVVDTVTKEVDPDLARAVIRPIPIKSPLYMYQMKISRRRDAGKSKWDYFDDYAVWDCNSCKIHKKPLNFMLLDFFIHRCVQLEQEDAMNFKSTLVETFPEIRSGESIDLTWEIYSKAMKEIGLGDRIHDRPVPEVIRYIFCDEVEFLTKFYNETIILNMIPAELKGLYHKLSHSPFELFFFKMTNFKFRLHKQIRQRRSVPKTNEDGVEAVEGGDVDNLLEEEQDEGEDDSINAQMREMVENLTFNRDVVAKSCVNHSLKLELFWLYLPEIDAKKLDGIEVSLLTKSQKATIEIYNIMKDSYYKDNDSFVHTFALKDRINYISDPEEQTREFDGIMNWLCNTPLRASFKQIKNSGYSYTIAKKYNDVYYLSVSHLHMMTIVESIMLLFDRFAMRKSEDMAKRDRESHLEDLVGADAKQLLCSNLVEYVDPPKVEVSANCLSGMNKDQVKCFYQVMDLPCNLLVGGAGTGKTFLLKRIIGCFQRGEVLALASQGRNVAALADVHDGYSFTFANFLYMHAKGCVTGSWASSNTFRWKGDNNSIRDINQLKELNGIYYKRCICENVKVVVWDETSLTTDSYAASALAVLSRCSQMEKLIICGDYRQCPPIGPGQFMKEFKKFADARMLTAELTKNMRSGPSTIFENGEAIARGDFAGIKFDEKTTFFEYYNTGWKDTEDPDFGKKAVEVAKKYDIPHYESTFLSHTNVIRKSVNPFLEAYYLGFHKDENNYLQEPYVFRTGSKIITKANLYLPGNVTINNEVNRLERIEMYQPPKKENGQRMKNKELLRFLMEGGGAVSINTTNESRSYRSYKTRFIIQSLDHIAKDSKARRYLPFFGRYRRKVEKGYMSTVHGSQGGEFKWVVLFMTYYSKNWTREMVYTAFTRAKSFFIFVGDLHFLEDAVNNPTKPRNSELADNLIHSIYRRFRDNWKTWQVPSIYNDLAYLEENDVFEEPNIMDTTDEAILAALSHATLKEFDGLYQLFKLRRVCKRFKTIIDSREMWVELYRQMYNQTEKDYRYKMKNPLALESERICNLDKNKVANLVINSICPTIYKCQGKDCGNYIISSGSIISSFRQTYYEEEAKSELKIYRDRENKEKQIRHIKVKLCLCTCGYSGYCYITLKFLQDPSTVKDAVGNYIPCAADIDMNDRKGENKKNVKAIDTSRLKNAHPSVYEKSNRAAEIAQKIVNIAKSNPKAPSKLGNYFASRPAMPDF